MTRLGRGPIVIMYIWTALGTGAAGFRRATGVSDDSRRARDAAAAALSTARTGTAYVERVYTAIAVPALSLCYVRTGTGWQARVGRTGHVRWTPLRTPDGSVPAGTRPAEAASAAAATAGSRSRVTRLIREDADA